MKFKIVKCDIAEMDTDAIVLPANKDLRRGRGCSDSIYEKAGSKHLEQICTHIDKSNLQIGDSIITYGNNLKASIVIHTIVPKWQGGSNLENDKLAMAYKSALSRADLEGCISLAIPLLGAGNNGFAPKLAYAIAEASIRTFVPTNKLKEVYMVLYDNSTIKILSEIGVTLYKDMI